MIKLILQEEFATKRIGAESFEKLKAYWWFHVDIPDIICKELLIHVTDENTFSNTETICFEVNKDFCNLLKRPLQSVAFDEQFGKQIEQIIKEFKDLKEKIIDYQDKDLPILQKNLTLRENEINKDAISEEQEKDDAHIRQMNRILGDYELKNGKKMEEVMA